VIISPLSFSEIQNKRKYPEVKIYLDAQEYNLLQKLPARHRSKWIRKHLKAPLEDLEYFNRIFSTQDGGSLQTVFDDQTPSTKDKLWGRLPLQDVLRTLEFKRTHAGFSYDLDPRDGYIEFKCESPAQEKEFGESLGF
jgi:hypothetical protein